MRGRRGVRVAHDGDRAARAPRHSSSRTPGRARHRLDSRRLRSDRGRFGLDGLLPPVVEDLATQLRRVELEYASKLTDLGRHVFLRALQDRNSVLFYAFLERHLAELLPIVYTPTVGLACQQWSRIYRCERGLFLSWPERDRAQELLDNAVGDLDIDVVVVESAAGTSSRPDLLVQRRHPGHRGGHGRRDRGRSRHCRHARQRAAPRGRRGRLGWHRDRQSGGPGNGGGRAGGGRSGAALLAG